MRLLLAEDEKELSNALTVILKHNNFSVDAVYNGLDALDYISLGKYDGVILDIMMPGLDGISVLKKVRAAGNSVPILLLTAKGEIDDRVLGLDSGADDYLPKPFSTKELLARIRAMTRRKADITADNLLFVGDITLDRLKFELSCNGDTTGLSGKEFQMLEMLMLSPEQVISTELFMEKIWGLASTAGLITVFILVLIFSRAVVRPLEESYQKQKRFITDAGHEIKTPLTIIDANAEVLEMEVGENEWIRSIKNQVKRLSELTGKLVFLSKMDEESNILNFEDFSLSDAVSETAFPFETMAKAKNKELSINIEPNIIYRGDEYSIRQLVSVLLDNAIKYSPDGGKTELSLSSDGKRKRLRVKNSVEKIEKGDHSVLFERFYRSDESRNSQTGGHGIGLSIAKAIVTAHKGKISAHSEDGKSIEFTVIL